MSTKINFKNTVIPNTFQEIEVGEIFQCGDSIYIRIEECYHRETLDHEVEYDRDLFHACEIHSQYYNAVDLYSGRFCRFCSGDNIRIIDTEINVFDGE